MSESAQKAAFLSYASQDAEAARRIAEALRQAGIEVWFDQEELRGGDAWDQKIRKQIKECALFVPIISANTQARTEGYFRREWRMAVDRTDDMADHIAFLLPIVLDGTSDSEAIVPDRFRERQWTRLRPAERDYGGQARPDDADAELARFVSRVHQLLSFDRAVPAIRSQAGVQVAAPTGPDNKSIAVLAFADMSPAKDQEYFSDGVAEELLSLLAKIPQLRVIARTSSFSFKGRNTPILEIARQLGVAYVVEGSVRTQGNRVRITAQLIRTGDGSHVWSDRFDRDLKDVFAVQDEIAGLITRELQVRIVSSGAPAREINPEAHRLYLEGKFHLNQYSPDAIRKAVSLLSQAVEVEPTFAAGWVALSRAAWTFGGYAAKREDFDWGFPLARKSAEKALELNPDLAAAHVALAEVQGSHDFNWKAMAVSVRRAQELEPADPAVMAAALHFAITVGDIDRAIALARKVVEIDPVNPAIRVHYGYLLCGAGRYVEAEKQFRRTIELNPAAHWGHAGASVNLSLQGRFDEAVAEATLDSNEWSRLFSLAVAEWGRKNTLESEEALIQLIRNHGDVAAAQIAEIYAFRKDNDRAFEWLERSFRQRDPGLAWSRLDPFLSPLREDSRWDPFLRKLGLADDQLP